MALDIWIGNWNKRGSKLVASFEPEAYYIFLLPIFEDFEKKKGIMIDPHDGAYFAPKELDQVDELAAKAESLVLSQPEQIKVYMGTNLGTYYEPKNEAIYSTVRRSEFIEFIKKGSVPSIVKIKG